jgi:glyoxylase-like metal-dependent hydrolase (beta-lactamase superfamily II)
MPDRLWEKVERRLPVDVEVGRHGLPLPPESRHPVKLLPGVWQVGGGHLSDERDAAAYLLTSEGEAALIDCGSPLGLETLARNVRRLVAWRSVRLVVGTHGHFDHVGAVAPLRQHADFTFALHRADVGQVQTGDPDLTCAGWLYDQDFPPAEVDIALEGGEVFSVGAFVCEIIHLPGHTRGSVGVLVETSGVRVLVPGDAINGFYSPRISSDLENWPDSLRRLLAYEIDLMVPNHGSSVLLADVPLRVRAALRLLELGFLTFRQPENFK